MNIATLEPLLPEAPELLAKAEEIEDMAAQLGRHLHPRTLTAVTDLLRTVNSYYSNLIEGHETHPIDIERAMRKEYALNSKERDLQLEARAHVEVQVELERRLAEDRTINVCSEGFLCWLHKEFYRRLPDEFRYVKNPETGETEPVIPGSLRHHDVSVGRHIPPHFTELKEYLARIGEAYSPARFKGPEALVALAAAHHRVLWVHPFGDGNGRVARLMTDAYLLRIDIGGYGLWTASRGLARRRKEYVAMLDEADSPRWDDYDGRGALSGRALTSFCLFFLETCADQIGYMGKLLEVDQLADRIVKYGRLREELILPGASGNTEKGTEFRPEATKLLHLLVFRGSIPRKEVRGLLGLEERTARRVVSFLNKEGFISADSPKGPVALRIPAYAAPYFFPELYNPART